MQTPIPFETLLANGHGRAILHLRDHDPAPHRDAILHACTHNLTYDPQCESGRAPYLYEAVALSGDPEWLRDRILAALEAPEEAMSPSQLYSLAYEFARRGDAEARAALYAAFDRDAAGGDPFTAEELALLDGIAGLVHAAERIPTDEDGSEPWELTSGLSALEERDGKDSTRAALAALHNPRIDQMLASVTRLEAAQAERRKPGPRPAPLPYDEVRRRLSSDKPGMSRYQMSRWGQDASEEEVLLAAQDALAQTEPERQERYLRLFFRRAFPLDPAPLIALARTGGREVAWAARRALWHVRHADVRALAAELAGDPATVGDAVEILASNHEEGDDARVAAWMERPPADREDCDGLGMGVRDYADVHSGPDVMRALVALYEHGPCSLCRNGAVRRLMDYGPLPERMVEECRYDADKSTRELFR